ncbi:MAG: hypothetical protein RSA01_07920, partial [Clostridium sp.]
MFLISKIREIYIKSPSTYRNICYILSILFRHTYAFIIAATALLAYLIYYFTLRIDQSIYTVSIVGVIYLIMIYYLFRVVFIRRYTLKGIYLDRDNYKSLWEIVDSLVEEYKGPKIENIILTKKTNIKVILHKSKGIRGRYINSLEIGLPIVLGFSEKELKDSIALSVISASKIRNIKHRSYTKTLKLMESLFRDDALYSKSNVAVKNMILPVYKYIYNFYKEIISVALGEAKLESDKMYIETFGSKVFINTILKKKVHSYLVAEVFDRAIEKEIEETEEAIGNYYTKMSTYLNEL